MDEFQPTVIFCLIFMFLSFSILKLDIETFGGFHISKIYIPGLPEKTNYRPSDRAHIPTRTQAVDSEEDLSPF